MQKAIRECFSDCTVLTIAHRLHTIIDSDRIMCLSKGRIENFGEPYDLLKDKSTILYELVNNLEKSESIRLMQIAKNSKINKIKETNQKDQNIFSLANEQNLKNDTSSNFYHDHDHEKEKLLKTDY